MARNILGGKGKQVRGLRELELKMTDLLAIVDGDKNREIRKRVHDKLREAATVGKQVIHDHGMVARWPAQVLRSLFSYSDPAKSQPKKPTGLFGVNKERTMAEWRAAKNNRSPNAKVAPGGRVSMALATMYEFGTTRMQARPAFRPGLKRAKPMIRKMITAGLEEVIYGIVRTDVAG